MVADAIAEIVGRRITAVVVKEGDGPDWQVFLLFADGTSYEMYGSGRLGGAKGLDRADLDRVRQYMAGRQRVVLEVVAPTGLDGGAREQLRQAFSPEVAMVLRIAASDPGGGLVSPEFMATVEELGVQRGLVPVAVDDRFYCRFSRLTEAEVEALAEAVLKRSAVLVGAIFREGFSAPFAERLLGRYLEAMLYLLAVGVVGFDDDEGLQFGPVRGAPPGPLRERSIVAKIKRVAGRAGALWLGISSGVQ